MLARLDNLRWEFRLGIATRGVVDVAKADSCHYSTVDYAVVRAALRALDFSADDVFVDIGCGKGRVLCVAARQRLAGIIGVEFSAPLCAIARSNAACLRGRLTEIVVCQAAAERFDYSGATALFMFNPFGAATLDRVLGRIAACTSAVRLAFVNASEAQNSVFTRHGWALAHRFRRGAHEIGIFSSRPAASA